MNRFFKFLLITVVTGTFLYLLLEIFKLRNKIKLLHIQLQNTESFNSSVNVNPTVNPLHHTSEQYKNDDQINTPVIQEAEETEEHISREILEYEKELEQVDQLIDEINQKNYIKIETETIDLDKIENEITKLNTIEENNSNSLETTDMESTQSTQSTQSIDSTESIQYTNDIESTTDAESPNVVNVTEPTELISHYNNKFSKKVLQEMCVNNNLIKTGSKKFLIMSLLQNNLLDTTLEEKTDTIEKYTMSESIGEDTNDDNDGNGSKEDTENNDNETEVESYQETSTHSFDIEQHLDKSNLLHHLNVYNTQNGNQIESSLL